jgi:hypothetical protein
MKKVKGFAHYVDLAPILKTYLLLTLQIYPITISLEVGGCKHNKVNKYFTLSRLVVNTLKI